MNPSINQPPTCQSLLIDHSINQPYTFTLCLFICCRSAELNVFGVEELAAVSRTKESDVSLSLCLIESFSHDLANWLVSSLVCHPCALWLAEREIFESFWRKIWRKQSCIVFTRLYLYFLSFLIGSESLLFEYCLTPSSAAKFTSNCVFISSSDVPWRKGPFISFFYHRKGGNLCFRLISAVA